MGFSQEDWFIIDGVLNRIAKELRRIEQEERTKGSTPKNPSLLQDDNKDCSLPTVGEELFVG